MQLKVEFEQLEVSMQFILQSAPTPAEQEIVEFAQLFDVH